VVVRRNASLVVNLLSLSSPRVDKKTDIPKPKQISEEIKKETQVWFELMKSNNVGMSINVLKPINSIPNTFSINLKLNIIH
jgi:hypothetical protein